MRHWTDTAATAGVLGFAKRPSQLSAAQTTRQTTLENFLPVGMSRPLLEDDRCAMTTLSAIVRWFKCEDISIATVYGMWIPIRHITQPH